MNRRRRLVLRFSGCALIVVTLVTVTFAGISAGWLQGFQTRASDAVHPRGQTGDVVVVGVDAASVDELGVPWPWPRSLQADLVSRLAEAEPAVVVYDIVLAPAASGDDRFALAARRLPLVLAESVQTAGTTRKDVLKVEYATRPADQLLEAASASGHSAVTADPTDGVVRHVPLVVERDMRIVPSLAVAALGVVGGDDRLVVRPDAVQIGSRTIPTGERHSLTVSWSPDLTASPQRVVSAADVLRGRVAPEDFRGKAVFVGITDPTLGDYHLTPVNRQRGLPGVLVHANTYNTISTRAYLSSQSPGATAATVGLLALLAVLAVQFLPVWVGVLASMASVGIFGWLGLTTRADSGTVVNFVYPVLAVVAAWMLSGALRYTTESRQRRLVAGLFSQYVPEAIAARLIDDGSAERLAAGVRSEVTVLFCDLRGFTALSADHEPSVVRDVLNEFYEYSTRIILDHEGTVMQYVGDEVYAIFGAPMEIGDHAGKALRAAVQLQEHLEELDRRTADKTLPAIRFGIGVNTGMVVTADTGSSWRRQYAAVGDPVNVGARLCSEAAAGEVVFAESSRASAVDPPPAELAGVLEMKGVAPDFVAWRWRSSGRSSSHV